MDQNNMIEYIQKMVSGLDGYNQKEKLNLGNINLDDSEFKDAMKELL